MALKTDHFALGCQSCSEAEETEKMQDHRVVFGASTPTRCSALVKISQKKRSPEKNLPALIVIRSPREYLFEGKCQRHMFLSPPINLKHTWILRKQELGALEQHVCAALRQTQRFPHASQPQEERKYRLAKRPSVRVLVEALWQPKQHLAVSVSGVESLRLIEGPLCQIKPLIYMEWDSNASGGGSVVKSRRLHPPLL